MLCAFCVRDNLGDERWEFAFLTAPSAQAGHHKPEQVFVCLHKVGWQLDDMNVHSNPSRFYGLILQLSTLNFVQPERSVYLPSTQPLKIGRLRMFTSDSFAAHLLDLPILANETLDAVDVSAVLLRYEDILLGRVRVVGEESEDAHWFATPESTTFPEDTIDDHDDGNDEGQPNVEDIPQDMDLMALLDDTSKKARPTKRARTGEAGKKPQSKSGPALEHADHKGEATSSHGDAILDDPLLNTFLEEDDIKALRRARDLCKNSEECFASEMAECFGETNDSEDDIVEVMQATDVPLRKLWTLDINCEYQACSMQHTHYLQVRELKINKNILHEVIYML